ncbi:MAG: NADH-quinone oxidoreductase subunit I [Deltaproteobacteria bacterium]|nr:MAG: NADH-quinone oxidoreductase subunit I [Deltaproteobacteria bacterium]
MGLKQYLKNIWEAVYTIALGMKITARYGIDPSEEITQQYPEEKRQPAERFRGFLHNDVPRCIACTMCAKTCPVDCIEIEFVTGEDKKRKLTRFDINIGRCMYCGLCVEVCPTKCLTHTDGYEKASLSRGELILHFVEPASAEEEEAQEKEAEPEPAPAGAAPAENPSGKEPEGTGGEN